MTLDDGGRDDIGSGGAVFERNSTAVMKEPSVSDPSSCRIVCLPGRRRVELRSIATQYGDRQLQFDFLLLVTGQAAHSVGNAERRVCAIGFFVDSAVDQYLELSDVV